MVIGPIDYVWYWTRDMDRAVGFYRDLLGLALARRDGNEWAEFEAGPVRFALHGVVEGHPPEQGGTVMFRVPDLDAAMASLQGRGVEFVGEVGEVAGYARFATFRDPDGNRVEIIEYARHAKEPQPARERRNG